MTTPPRMKLSDVEANTRYLFRGEPTSFEKAFPEIERLRVEVRVERMWSGNDLPSVYTEDNLVPIVNCQNPLCYGGGLDIQRILRWDVVARKSTKFENSFSCVGYEGSPKGRRRTGRCDSFYNIKIEVVYKNAPQGGTVTA